MYKDDCDILIQATGALNNWKWPNIPGLHDFKGKLLHSATWDEDYEYTVWTDLAVIQECAQLQIESKCCRHWQRVQWHSDRSRYAAKGGAH